MLKGQTFSSRTNQLAAKIGIPSSAGPSGRTEAVTLAHRATISAYTAEGGRSDKYADTKWRLKKRISFTIFAGTISLHSTLESNAWQESY